jgi:hypothetical protein
MNLKSRLRKLECRRFDSTGLVPQSEAWLHSGKTNSSRASMARMSIARVSRSQ